MKLKLQLLLLIRLSCCTTEYITLMALVLKWYRSLYLWHNALFTDKEGKFRLVFHVHKDKSNIHPQAIYIGNFSFEKVDGVERMRICKEYVTPKLIE